MKPKIYSLAPGSITITFAGLGLDWCFIFSPGTGTMSLRHPFNPFPSFQRLGLPNLCVTEGGLVLNGSLVWFVFHIRMRRELQDTLDSIPKTFDNFSFRRGFVPNSQDIFRVSNGNDQSTNLPVGKSWKLATNQGHNDFLPVAAGKSLGQTNNPLASLGVGGVFPCGFDAIPKEVVIGSGRQVVGPAEIVVGPPEFFYRRNGVDRFDRVLIGMEGLGWLLWSSSSSSGGRCRIPFFWFCTLSPPHKGEGIGDMKRCSTRVLVPVEEEDIKKGIQKRYVISKRGEQRVE